MKNPGLGCCYLKSFHVKCLKCSALKVDEEPITQAKKRKKLDYDDDDDDEDNDDEQDVSPIKINLKPTRYDNHDGRHLHLQQQTLISKATYNCEVNPFPVYNRNS